MTPLTFGSLFAGIGGFDLGFERAGMVCKWQVEIDDYANRVLAKHWPNVRRWPDVRTWPQPDTEWVDVICGGFPCQDISNAGKREGITGKRSWLWCEFARIIREVRPRFAIVENVSALLIRGLDRVLGDLAEMGYNAEWGSIPADFMGACHQRERIFTIANCQGINGKSYSPKLRGEVPSGIRAWWKSTPGVLRVDDGVPNRLDRNRCLGNAVVPQVAEWIGRRIVEACYK